MTKPASQCPTCPTCNSEVKNERLCMTAPGTLKYRHPCSLEACQPCTDPWHSTPSVETPRKIVMGATDDGFEYATVPTPASMQDVPQRWINEDELPDGYPYDKMFPLSKLGHDGLGGVRIFPEVAQDVPTSQSPDHESCDNANCHPYACNCRDVPPTEDWPQDLQDYRNAPSGVGPHAFTWKDKPHRLIYDLCSMLKAYASQQNAELRAEVERLKNVIRDCIHELGTLKNTTGSERIVLKRLREGAKETP